MFESKEITFGTNVYTITDWSAVKAIRWQRRLVGKLGKSVPHLINDTKSEMPTGPELQSAIDGLLDTLTEETLIAWLTEILEGVQLVKGGEGKGLITLENFKGGTTFEMYKLVYEVLKWQLRDFFQGLQGAKNILAKVMALKTK